jgi:hypothetical protein
MCSLGMRFSRGLYTRTTTKLMRIEDHVHAESLMGRAKGWARWAAAHPEIRPKNWVPRQPNSSTRNQNWTSRRMASGSGGSVYRFWVLREPAARASASALRSRRRHAISLLASCRPPLPSRLPPRLASARQWRLGLATSAPRLGSSPPRDASACTQRGDWEWGKGREREPPESWPSVDCATVGEDWLIEIL